MPRKASGRKAASKSGRKSASAAERSAARQTGKDIPDAPAGPKVDRIASKNANPAHRAPSEETARLNAASQTGGVKPEQPTEEQLREVQKTQGPSGHPLGTAKAPKPNLNKAVAKVQGQTKILREKGTPPKAEPRRVVQQGGGGAVTESGDAIR